MSAAPSAEEQLVLEWHAALNAGDVSSLLSLCANDVEVGGPRGVGRGADVLRDWVGRANIQLEPLRIEQHGATLVVEQQAAWSDGAPQSAASVFEVQGGRVTRVIRYPDWASALEAARA